MTRESGGARETVAMAISISRATLAGEMLPSQADTYAQLAHVGGGAAAVAIMPNRLRGLAHSRSGEQPRLLMLR